VFLFERSIDIDAYSLCSQNDRRVSKSAHAAIGSRRAVRRLA